MHPMMYQIFPQDPAPLSPRLVWIMTQQVAMFETLAKDRTCCRPQLLGPIGRRVTTPGQPLRRELQDVVALRCAQRVVLLFQHEAQHPPPTSVVLSAVSQGLQADTRIAVRFPKLDKVVALPGGLSM